ncbi:uncharacterized protein [Medicago truncatula]|uniref:uncharacterized protein n=1 Tax=Medicago truncatula TaxID=3880 RepID=UPI000D2F1789|nr:uncharacterized protein LOC112422016 [Medicago truncatula]
MEVRRVVMEYFTNHVAASGWERPTLDGVPFAMLNEEDNLGLVAPFSSKEIEEIVKDSDGDKSPGPDGFNFAFVKRFWHLIKGEDYRPISLLGCLYKLVAKVLARRLAKVMNPIISLNQSAFLKGRNLVDGVMAINEIVDFAKKFKKECLILKVDFENFEKAYDSVDWGFLVYMMKRVGMCSKWIARMKACVCGGTMSILVNGSPTEEINIHTGLKQGDPLAPFLFLLVAEGFSGLLRNAVRLDLFQGFKMKEEGKEYSHLQYADDTICMGKATVNNLWTLKALLRGFELASGLKVELGVPTKGEGGSRGEGCEIWRWKLLNGEEALWKEVLVERYGREVCAKLEGGEGSHPNNASKWWKDLVNLDKRGEESWFNEEVERCVGNGANTLFWKEAWRGEVTFKEKYYRLFSISTQQEATVEAMWNGGIWSFLWRRRLFVWEETLLHSLLGELDGFVRTNVEDRWRWRLDEVKDFKVKSLYVKLEKGEVGERVHSDDENIVFQNIWKVGVPSKVTAFMWKALLDKIPTRGNLEIRRCLPPDFGTRCVWCTSVLETTSHIFLHCDLARSVWLKLMGWLDLNFIMPPNLFIHWECWSAGVMNKKIRKGLRMIWQAAIWSIWKAWNDCVFNGGVTRWDEVVEDIKFGCGSAGCSCSVCVSGCIREVFVAAGQQALMCFWGSAVLG